MPQGFSEKIKIQLLLANFALQLGNLLNYSALISQNWPYGTAFELSRTPNTYNYVRYRSIPFKGKTDSTIGKKRMGYNIYPGNSRFYIADGLRNVAFKR